MKQWTHIESVNWAMLIQDSSREKVDIASLRMKIRGENFTGRVLDSIKSADNLIDEY